MAPFLPQNTRSRTYESIHFPEIEKPGRGFWSQKGVKPIHTTALEKTKHEALAHHILSHQLSRGRWKKVPSAHLLPLRQEDQRLTETWTQCSDVYEGNSTN